MSDAQIELVKQKNDIVEIVGERVTLKKAGRNFSGLCPFHGEKTPSFHVSAEMQIFKCFGCGVSGDVISFIQQFESLSFGEALEYLAGRAGVVLEKAHFHPQDKKRERLLEILHLADEYYHYLLTEHPIGKNALAYLKDRGVGSELIRHFHLGYALENWEGLLTFLSKKKGYEEQEIAAAGMAIRSDKGRGYYDRFRGRIMFPLTNYAGKVVGFAGRVLNPTAKEAKYINTPETELYHKSELLYGLSLVKNVIRQKDRVIVVEGEMDVLASYRAGVTETVAIKGSALTEDQVLQLRKLTNNIILALDADEAGQEAMSRGITIAEKQGVSLRVVRISEGKDPGDVATENPKRWHEMVEAATPVYQFYLDWAFDRFDVESGQGQKEISAFLAPILAKITNPVEQAFYFKRLAERLGTTVRVVEELVKRVQRGLPVKKTEKKEVEMSKMSRRERLERLVVSTLLQFEDLKNELHILEAEWIQERYLKELVEEIKTVTGNGHYRIQEVVAGLSAEKRALVEKLYAHDATLMEEELTDLEKMYVKAVRDLKTMWMRERLKKLIREMSELPKDDPTMYKMQAEYRSLSEEANRDSG